MLSAGKLQSRHHLSQSNDGLIHLDLLYLKKSLDSVML